MRFASFSKTLVILVMGMSLAACNKTQTTPVQANLLLEKPLVEGDSGPAGGGDSDLVVAKTGSQRVEEIDHNADVVSIIFGDDTSEWALDGVCDDPRFAGDAMDKDLLDEDKFRDAQDCRAGVKSGALTLKPNAQNVIEVNSVAKATIDFGVNGGDWAGDGLCDDARFAGIAISAMQTRDRIFQDAGDCAAAFDAGNVHIKKGAFLTQTDADAAKKASQDFAGTDLSQNTGKPDFGDDSYGWADDGNCDDKRFVGEGMSRAPYMPFAVAADASDCRAAWDAGSVTWRTDESLGLKGVGAQFDGIDFGADATQWAQDGKCDDTRFDGEMIGSRDHGQGNDRTDCLLTYRAGTVALIESKPKKQ